jgi:hypothetical protein
MGIAKEDLPPFLQT